MAKKKQKKNGSISNLNKVLEIGDRAFKIPLCLVQESLGPVVVDHYWIDIRKLYGQRKRSPALPRTIADCFWAICRQHGAHHDRENQEVYTLARLLPEVRSNASRSIFRDARLTARADERRKAAAELEEMLQASAQEALTSLEFHKKTGDLLGHEPYSESDKELYYDVTKALLDRACGALTTNTPKAIRSTTAAWRAAIAKWGRRSGAEQHKLVLNVLSYEAKVALHRCYSAVWEELRKQMFVEKKISEVTYLFLLLWHQDICNLFGRGTGTFHLLHGHILGLHPGSGTLLTTATGRRLVGEWLADPDSPEAFYRVLNAICVCLFSYAQRHEAMSTDRKRRPSPADDLAEIEQRSIDRRSGGKKPKRRSTDAR